MIKSRNAGVVTCAVALGLMVGCGEDEDRNPSEGSDASTSRADGGEQPAITDPDEDAGSAPGDDERDGGSVPAEKPVYALATQVFGASDQTSYLRIHEGDLFAEPIASSGGIERPGRALVATGQASGSVYYAGDKRADVDRYDLEGGELLRGDTVSFSGEGVSAIAEYPGQLVFVSATKALYFDARTLKVIVWNPRDMTLITSISVADLAVKDFAATFSTVTATKGDKVYVPVGYRTPAAVPSAAAVVVIDTANDTATVVKDDRCGYVRDAAEGDDGKWYLATEAFGSAVHYLDENAAPAPCLLRFDFDTDRYDPDFYVDLNELAGGRTAGSLVRLPNGKLYTRVLDPELVPVMPIPSGRAFASALAWGWSELTLGDTPSLTDVPDGRVMGGSIIPFALGELMVIPNFAEDLSHTTLCDMSDGPTCSRSALVDGLVFSIAQLE